MIVGDLRMKDLEKENKMKKKKERIEVKGEGMMKE